jgi:hypothetical protein
MELKGTKKWDEQKISFLKANFRILSYSEIAIAIDMTKEQCSTKCKSLKLKRTPEEQTKINERTNTGVFKKDVKPWNAGTIGVVKAKSTSFKKGNNQNKSVWYDKAIVITRDEKTGKCRKKIRIDNQWKYYSRYVWEDNFGPIPDGHIIIFKDGDSLNCEAWNLECISKQEALNRQNFNKKQAREAKKQLYGHFKNHSGKRVSKKSLNKPSEKINDGKIPVRIDSKTLIFVKEGADIEKIKNKYLENKNKL